MNAVGELLTRDDILLDVDVPDKARLLQRVAAHLAQRLSLPAADVLQSLVAREQLGSTALGHGVALPHARMPQCYAVAGVFMRTRLAIAFDAPDHKPVSLFLALVVPRQATEHHFQLLAAAATMFHDRALREQLRSGADASAVQTLLATWQDQSSGADNPGSAASQ